MDKKEICICELCDKNVSQKVKGKSYKMIVKLTIFIIWGEMFTNQELARSNMKVEKMKKLR